jgi:hypothetical protein
MAKDYVIVKGKVVRMNDAAYKIASKHFGATKSRPGLKEIPLDLLRIPKFPIIPTKIQLARQPIPVVETAPVIEPVKEVNLPKEVKVDLPEVQAQAKRVVKRTKK